jgi:hypothetical protein
MIFGMKKVETLGGIGSILTGLMCIGIGLMDYFNGQSWKIWVIMTVVLVVNGVAMLISASRRHESAVVAGTLSNPVQQVASART